MNEKDSTSKLVVDKGLK